MVAKALRGAWRASPPTCALTAPELADISPLLYITGTGALVWRAVRESALKNTPAADTLRQAHRLQLLEAARSERDIQAAFKALRSEGIEPLLFKGWAAAGHYPERGLRPWGDVDLYVPPRDYAKAEKLVEGSFALRCAVDLFHEDFADLDERGVEELYARSRTMPLGDVEVRVPGDEDHLRLLCLHWLRHNAWRPLWLCDIAAALENRGADFDWDVCLGRSGNARQPDWIICTLALARELLGAQVNGAPDAVREARAPRWLARTVLKQWAVPAKQHRPDNLPMLTILRRQRPGGILKALRDRWPNALEATYGRRGPFTRQPRLPYQLGLYLARAVRLQARLPGLLRGES
ncbi:MAG TPA: nucleotidyltransferase family protein [Pyrinomonadaceae bacterium]